MNKEQIIKALHSVVIFGENENIISSKALQNLQVFHEEIIIDLLVHNPAMHVKKKIEIDIKNIIHKEINPKAKIIINIKIKTPEKVQIRGSEIPGIKNIIAIASGKGGVGKSTIVTNISIILTKMGFNVGILDADIYGPSIPIMFGVEDKWIKSIYIDGKEKMEPIENYNVKLLSLGFFAKHDQAVVWRGPMATKALRQFIRDSNWGVLDFLIIDLPPGTSDIHLSLVQEIPLTGVVVISTPQKMALIDVRKAIAMFHIDSIKVPILGIIENMSYFIPNDLPNNKYFIFGEKGASQFAVNLKIPFLGEIPIIQNIREASDIGEPDVLQKNSVSFNFFEKITKNIIKEIIYRNKKLPPTESLRITTMAGCSNK